MTNTPKTLEQQVPSLAPVSEAEFMQERTPGALARVMLPDAKERSWIVYEGEHEGKQSFIVQGESPEIRTYESALRYLQFGPEKPQDAIGTISFDHLHTSYNTLEQGTERYNNARAMLERAGRWTEFKLVTVTVSRWEKAT